MGVVTNQKRILSQTYKQIRRSGWLAWASVLVMALAFFIASVFVLIAYTSNLFLQSVENEPHIYVFFNVGTEDSLITELQTRWSNLPEIERIEYTSESGALDEFKQAQERENPIAADALRTNVLPASLGIRLYSIQDAEKIIQITQAEADSNEDILAVRYSKDTIDTIKSLFYWLRIAGGVIMGLLLIVIFTFTLLTVEFRTFNRAEEIGIMQLVGGSLWYIRAPFILEGAVYGLLGALISVTTIYGLAYVVFVVNRSAGAVNFLINFFSDLRWPYLDPWHYAAIFLSAILFGSLIGAFNSYIAIRRYIN